MKPVPTASIIISSYNYGRYLRQAIDSALAQEWPSPQVIVVDDGSADDSPAIIRSYGARITAIFQQNGGQAAAINRGFAASRGQIVLLLDSDDVLLPTATARAAEAFADPAVIKVHWPMRVIDRSGQSTGRRVPDQPLSKGDLRAAILQDGPEAYEWPPTSGNAWRRSFLQQALPIPEEAYRVCPDLYLAALVGIAGWVQRINEPQSMWRMHGQNNTWGKKFQPRLEAFILQWDLACDALVERCEAQGLSVDPERWRGNAWCHRVRRVAGAICSIVPPGQSFILIDDNDWGADEEFFGRHCLPFLERAGQYWGKPPDDRTAILELERMRQAGASFLALAWPAFWWRTHFSQFMEHLRGCYSTAMEAPDVVVYRLGEVRR
jgi:hypothetical protein